MGCDSVSWDFFFFLLGLLHYLGPMSLLSLGVHYGTLFEGCALTAEDF